MKQALSIILMFAVLLVALAFVVNVVDADIINEFFRNGETDATDNSDTDDNVTDDTGQDSETDPPADETDPPSDGTEDSGNTDATAQISPGTYNLNSIWDDEDYNINGWEEQAISAVVSGTYDSTTLTIDKLKGAQSSLLFYSNDAMITDYNPSISLSEYPCSFLINDTQTVSLGFYNWWSAHTSLVDSGDDAVGYCWYCQDPVYTMLNSCDPGGTTYYYCSDDHYPNFCDNGHPYLGDSCSECTNSGDGEDTEDTENTETLVAWSPNTYTYYANTDPSMIGGRSKLYTDSTGTTTTTATVRVYYENSEYVDHSFDELEITGNQNAEYCNIYVYYNDVTVFSAVEADANLDFMFDDTVYVYSGLYEGMSSTFDGH